MAINRTVKNAVGEKIIIYAKDIEKPDKMPAIKIEVDNIKNRKFNSCMKEMTIPCWIYYFPSDSHKYRTENLKIMQKITQAFFDGLYVKEGFFIPIDEVESNVIDGVLICNFYLKTRELFYEEQGEFMENLEMDSINFKGVD